MVLRKKSILLIMVFLIGCFVCACGKEKSVVGETLAEKYLPRRKQKALRKKLQSSGKRAMDFQWMNRRKKKLRMTAKK